MTEPITFTVPAFSIPFSDLYLTESLRLNQFQAEVRSRLEREEDILLVAPTGGGKTLTLLLNPHSVDGVSGFVAIYPNNTLLANQLCTVEEVILDHFNAKLVESKKICRDEVCGARRCECLDRSRIEECIEPLTIYEVNKARIGGLWEARYIALLAISGRYFTPEDQTKAQLFYEIAEKVLSHRRKGGIYVIVFTTPDTYLLLRTGAYRNFELVGKALHNLLLAMARGDDLDGVLRKSGVLTRSQVSDIRGAVERLLEFPLFVDEFHLYGPYEIDALYAILKLNRELGGEPVVLSSATPAEDIVEELSNTGLSPNIVRAQTINGDGGFMVRGKTFFILHSVSTERKGLSAYFKAAEDVPRLAEGALLQKLRDIKDGRALIILERLWMVASVAEALSSKGLDVECIASIFPRGACRAGGRIIVGSEATTQGVNLGKVVLGITSGTSSEDVIQRIGRVGRRGVDSEVHLVVPEYALEKVGARSFMDYWGLVETVKSLYPDYPKRKRDISRFIPQRFHELRRRLIHALSMASMARISGVRQIYEAIKIDRDKALDLLNSVIGPPQAYTRILMFRRTGFNVGFVEEDSGYAGEASIGILARNFLITKVMKDGRLMIKLERSRSRLTIRALGNPISFLGKFVDLKHFLKAIEGRIEINEDLVIGPEQIGDTLVYVLDAGTGLSDYLSFSGEGAEIHSPVSRRYALIFI